MNQKAIGQRIKKAREKKQLTQEQLSELVDLSPMHISVIERGAKIRQPIRSMTASFKSSTFP